MYALVKDSEVLKIGKRPNWLIGDAVSDSRPLTDEELAEHGWFPIQEADQIPEGMIAVSQEVQLIEGLPKWVLELEDAPPPSSFDVDRERDRRIDGSMTFGGASFQTRPPDRENIAGASVAALAAIMNGAQVGDLRWHGGDSDFVWIAEDNSLHSMDAQTMFAFGQAAMAHKEAHIFAARALKDSDPIPADYDDDRHWPTSIP